MQHGAALPHRLPFKRMAPSPSYGAAFPRGNDFPRNRLTACSWQGAKCLPIDSRTRGRKRQRVLSSQAGRPFIPRLKDGGFLAHLRALHNSFGRALPSMREDPLGRADQVGTARLLGGQANFCPETNPVAVGSISPSSYRAICLPLAASRMKIAP